MTQQSLPDQADVLPDAPTPWAASSMPPVRTDPPFLMTKMIEAEPALARRLMARLAADPAVAALAGAVRTSSGGGRPIVVTGCGTSEHAAQAVAAIVAGALASGSAPLVRPVARQAFEIALDPPAGGLLIAVSHEGATWATNRAIEVARASGATTALITVSERSPGASLADIVVATHELDQSWCHTVAYVSPMLVAVALEADLTSRSIDGDDIGRLLEAGLAQGSAADGVARALADAAHVLVVASGVDRTSASELALKIEEGAQIPATARDVETVLHGHLAATDRLTRVILIVADREHRGERASRARDVLAAAAEIGMPAVAIVTPDVEHSLDPLLTPAARIACPEERRVGGPAAALLGAAIPLQLLAERLARTRGTSPDTIRREEPAYAEAAARADRA